MSRAALLAAQVPQPRSYFDKSVVYLAFDVLIVLAPLSALIALALLFDPIVSHRPKEWRRSKSLTPMFRKKLVRRMTLLYFFSAESGLGALIFLLHWLDLIPKGL